MKIAFFSKKNSSEEKVFIEKTISHLLEKRVEIVFYEDFFRSCAALPSQSFATFKSHEELAQQMPIDYLFTLGGDGTFLEAAHLLGDMDVPMVGINTGRIGFLTSINKTNFETCFQLLLEQNYEIERRSLLHLSTDAAMALPTDFAVNDITIHPETTGSFNAIKVWLDGKKVNTYWADGLIFATPTGSTAYSLSCGGPILMPSANAITLTPIASHTLAVRPIVVPADSTINVIVESRSRAFTISLDSYKLTIPDHVRLTITKEKFAIQTVRFPAADFFSVIREKLMWGIDRRNIDE